MSSRQITEREHRIPAALNSFFSKWGLLIPKHMIFLNVSFLNIPHVKKAERYNIINFQADDAPGSIISVQAFYGYMQQPDVRRLLVELKEQKKIKIPAEAEKWLVLVAVDRFIVRPRNIFKRLRIYLLDFMVRYTKPITNYYGLGYDHKVDIETINI